MKVGVLGVQGAVNEHMAMVEASLEGMDVLGTSVLVRKPAQIADCDALIIPGGESTVISHHLERSGLGPAIRKRCAKEEFPIMGTCAGMVLLAKRVRGKESWGLGLMDMEVKRNAFGGQRESFEADLDIEIFKRSYHAVFIRAPVATRVWGGCKMLSKLDQKIVAARQKSCLAFAYHPELTDDTRIHQYFLSLIV